MNRVIPTGRSRQKGLALVEFVLTAPFLLVMMLLAAEFTRVFYEYNTLTKGVRDAARLMTENAYTGAGVFELSETRIAQAKNVVVYGSINNTGSPVLKGLTTGQVSVLQKDQGSAPLVREHVEVSVAYPYQGSDIPGLGFLSKTVDMSFTLTASSTMRGL